MSTPAEITARQECQKSLSRIQEFDPNVLARKDDLGSELNFQEVVPEANRLIGLYKQISQSVLEDLPQNQLDSLKNSANADYNRFEQILKFTTKQDNANAVRTGIVQQFAGAYQGTFSNLHPLISYSTSKSADFKRLGNTLAL